MIALSEKEAVYKRGEKQILVRSHICSMSEEERSRCWEEVRSELTLLFEWEKSKNEVLSRKKQQEPGARNV